MTFLDELTQIVDAATEGPWHRGSAIVYSSAVQRAGGGDYKVVLPGSVANKDLDYIARFDPETMRLILAVVQAAEGVRDSRLITADDAHLEHSLDEQEKALEALAAHVERRNE